MLWCCVKDQNVADWIRTDLTDFATGCWPLSVVEIASAQLRKESSDLTAGLRAEYAKLFSLLPADEESWMRFQHAVKHLPELVEQRNGSWCHDALVQAQSIQSHGHGVEPNGPSVLCFFWRGLLTKLLVAGGADIQSTWSGVTLTFCMWATASYTWTPRCSLILAVQHLTSAMGPFFWLGWEQLQLGCIPKDP